MLALAAGLGMFLAALDIALNVALPAITRDFDTDLQTVQWVIVAFIATRAGLVMGAGSFADRFCRALSVSRHYPTLGPAARSRGRISPLGLGAPALFATIPPRRRKPPRN